MMRSQSSISPEQRNKGVSLLLGWPKIVWFLAEGIDPFSHKVVISKIPNFVTFLIVRVYPPSTIFG